MRKVAPEDEIPIWMLDPDVIAAKLDHFNNKRIDSPDTAQCQRELIEYVESLNRRSFDTHEWVARTHELADRFMLAYKDYLICRKGCSHCCRLPVGVTYLEAEYISVRSGRKLNRKAKECFDIKPTPQNSTPCPFLAADAVSCSIYAFRPLACRMFGTFDDHHFCEDPTKDHMIVTSDVSRPFAYSTGMMISAAKQARGKQPAAFAELRQWFR
ncbi:YkgJ family cysteine cluster protein [Escherichia coli]